MTDTLTTMTLSGRRLAGAIALLVAVGLTWGSSYSIAKIVTEAGFDPLGMTLWQGLGGGIALGFVGLVRRRLPPLRLTYLRFYLLCGFLGTALPSAVWFWVAPKLQSGIVAISAALVPLVTLALALAFRVERFEPKRALGIGLGLAAILLIVVPESGLPDPAMVGWMLLSLIIPACYAAENMVLTIMRPPRIDSLTLLCGMLLANGIIMLPVVVLTDGWIDLAGPWTSTHWYFALLVTVNAVSYAMFIELIRIAGPVFAAQEGYVITASGVLWGILVFSEMHSIWVWLAIGVMFAGFALVSPRRRVSSA
ncbi:MAG: DMT family transporter [Alphaproteobacteria bacterium]|nr:DMT family transporter [Alphaproteobacteria bacterium]